MWEVPSLPRTVTTPFVRRVLAAVELLRQACGGRCPPGAAALPQAVPCVTVLLGCSLRKPPCAHPGASCHARLHRHSPVQVGLCLQCPQAAWRPCGPRTCSVHFIGDSQSKTPGRKRLCLGLPGTGPYSHLIVVAGEADAGRNNGASSRDTAVTDSKRTADPNNAWQGARPADPRSRPHLIRLFSRDAPGREDNTFKDRPSESDELQTIQEDSAAAPQDLDVMASQKRPSQRHGSKYLATASTMDHARHGFLPRHRDTGILDSIGRFFSSDRGAPKRGSGKDHAARTTHYGSLPQKSHGRPQDENPVVHFFKNIVTPRTPPPSQGKGRGTVLSRFSWGAEGQKPGFGYGGRAADYKSAHKGLKGADAQGTLSRLFKLGGRDSRSGSPMARR
uniref:Myelin basic protein n=1 Tax=Oryctolagus cuniculus TaxID=9986 RepID=G1THX0_RABIT